MGMKVEFQIISIYKALGLFSGLYLLYGYLWDIWWLVNLFTDLHNGDMILSKICFLNCLYTYYKGSPYDMTCKKLYDL